MAQLTVRNITDHLVAALKQRAGGHGRSAEAEHREILRRALVDGERDGVLVVVAREGVPVSTAAS